MTKIENELRAYVESLKTDLLYKNDYKGWAFGAVDFLRSAGMIDRKLYDMLLQEYSLLDN